VSTGLPGSLARVSCIGGDVPAPNWNAFAASASAIPTTCTTGSNSFADAAPNVVAFDRDWETPRSWRANLAWQSVFQRVTYSVEGIYSLNLNQPGTSDLNFANAPRFTLRDEGRAIFAPAASIVPATGIVSAVDGRIAPSYGRVLDVRGDGRS